MSRDQNLSGEERFSHSELRLRQITDTIPAHVGYFDHDWVFRYGNRRYAQWFGTTSEGMKDRSILEVIGQHVFDQVEDKVRRALAGEEVSYEYSMPGRDGSALYARSTLVPDFSPEGEVVGCYVHAVDITEQRRTQSALAQAQKMEAIGQLTGGLAHDFNNMLTVVMGNLQGLAEALADHPEAAAIAAEYVEPAMAAAEGGAGLVRRLLAFSRQQPIVPMVVEVNELVLGMARLIRRSLPNTINIATASRDVELHALVDPNQLESALLNLALNARDVMPNGGELRIECSLDCIDGAVAADLELASGCYVQIAVSDNGTGMDSATLTHVFEPFFTTKKFGLGSGLGMAMVYGFIKQSGGGVRIRSRQAVGTTVSLLLPCAPRSTLLRPVSQAAEAQPAKRLDGRLVMLVEDDDKVREVVRKQLSSLGCAVLEAESGHEAADMIENIPAIALVLSDIVMPGGMDGRALARFVRRFRPELPVVLMSGYAERTETGREDADVPMLDKPFTQERLVEVLHAAIT
ncbi:Histidine kinase [Thauera humireducens]|uniref:histidine kinase n=1 Tax=Thauera humireducens TaxID=1134435 RepID=A0A127K6P8_9RHOO|nr:ATP-binding protein [Thauera humireducens]AMO37630.1 hybrid sensor histidine kinase/response regulator [Thauera humireducens]CAH1747039.1 Histidine kinase [Thauera humireducens]